jgi:hypothetical protein
MARTRKKKPSPNGKPEVLFPSGAPVDASGAPADDAEVDEQLIIDGLPLDSESARMLQKGENILSKKAAGDKNVKWDAPMPIRFSLAKRYAPDGYVRFKQVDPDEDDNILPRPISLFNDFSDLVKYLREHHWKGDASQYQWQVFTHRQPCICTGQVNFKADPDRIRSREEEMPPPSPPQYPPGYPPQYPPGYPPPGYPPPQYPPGYPPPYPQQQQPYAPPPGYPPPPPPPPPFPGSVQAQVPQPQPPPVAPVPSPHDPALVQWLIQQNMNLSSQVATLIEDQRRQIHAPPPTTQTATSAPVYPSYPYWWYQQQQQQQQPQPVPEKQKTPLELLSELQSTITEVQKFGKTVAKEVGYVPPEQHQANPATPVDDNFPIPTKTIGGVTVMADQNGKLNVPWMLNIGKIEEIGEKVFDKFGGKLLSTIQMLGEQRMEMIKQQRDIEDRREARERGMPPPPPPPVQKAAPPPPPPPEPPKSAQPAMSFGVLPS